MEFKKLIDERRSVRRYSSGINREDLEKILRAAQRAPSWGNRQASRCYAVTDEEIVENCAKLRFLPPIRIILQTRFLWSRHLKRA